ncbi:MAG: sugar transferase [Cyclobacteriaceae bacterium]|nr:sugar transferase [Cyclobacteriaceae bacterium]
MNNADYKIDYVDNRVLTNSIIYLEKSYDSELNNAICLFQNTFRMVSVESLILSAKKELLNTVSAIIIEYDCENNEQLGNIQEIKQILGEVFIPIVLYATKISSTEKLNFFSAGVDDVRSNFDSELEFSKWVHYSKMIWVMGGRVNDFESLNKGTYNDKISLSKRVFDIVISSILLLLLSPLLILVSLIIKLESKGPVFYVSRRAGRGYKVFDFYKFRSMRMDSDKKLKDLWYLNCYESEKSEDEIFFKLSHDPRVTKFGKFIRNTSIDELPQLFNVLFGDMSLVGNRPLPLYEAEQLVKDEVAMRFLAPAGITGLWQVTKRGKHTLSNSERIQLDIDYARKNSFKYDLKILFKTFPALFQQDEY